MSISICSSRRRALALAVLVSIVPLAACSGSDGSSSTATPTIVDTVSDLPATSAAAGPESTTPDPVPTTSAGEAPPGTDASDDPVEFFDEATVHSISISFNQSDYDAMIETFRADGDKTWIEAEVTIDGEVYKNVGMRLKGNSSLAGIGGGIGDPGGFQPPEGGDGIPAECAAAFNPGAGAGAGAETDGTAPTNVGPPGGGGGFGVGGDASAEKPETLPWLIRLDKYVDDQQHQGHTSFVVRSNGSKTALNELISLDLLDSAGLASQQAALTRISVNGGEERLRLVIELMNDEWQETEFGGGLLYKADAQGDYSYRGTDPEAYNEAWDQEAGEDDLTPLIEFLDFVNNSTDEEFASKLSEHLDVEAFAKYLAIEDLFQNFDDIAGPGNNSYLHYDPATEKFTVIAWDHNLSFGSIGGGGGFPGGGFPGGGTAPTGGGVPGGFDPSAIPEECRDALGDAFGGAGGGPGGGPGGGGQGGLFGRSNTLADRFMANTEFKAMYDAETESLRTSMFSSGEATSLLEHWTTVIERGADDLVDDSTIASESKTISDIIAG